MPSAQRLMILFVEDDPLQAKVARQAFEGIQAGAALVHAENGSLALDHLRSNPGKIDVVLTDLFMPVLDGLGLLRAMKEDPVLRCIPVIILTGSTHRATVRQAYESHAANVFQKPETVEELRRLLGIIVEFFREGAPRVVLEPERDARLQAPR